VAYNTSNTIKKFRINTQHKEYNSSDVYKLKCLTCEQMNEYVGQTGRNLRTRYEERIRNIQNNKVVWRYAMHILQRNHECGPIGKHWKY
jgi:hypothetical protein